MLRGGTPPTPQFTVTIKSIGRGQRPHLLIRKPSCKSYQNCRADSRVGPRLNGLNRISPRCGRSVVTWGVPEPAELTNCGAVAVLSA